MEAILLWKRNCARLAIPRTRICHRVPVKCRWSAHDPDLEALYSGRVLVFEQKNNGPTCLDRPVHPI